LFYKTLFFGIVFALGEISGVYAAENPMIRKLLVEKKQKMEKLEMCAKKVKGFKIAGISTLGLTAVGVGGNIALAVKQKSLEREIQSTKDEIAKQESILEKLKAEIPEATPTVIKSDFDIPDNGRDFSLLCRESSPINCEIVGKKVPKLQYSCEKDLKIEPGHPLFLPLSGPGMNECYDQVHNIVRSADVCDIRRALYEQPQNSMLLFCDGDANIVYTEEARDKRSYAEKKCTGSIGKWQNNECVCESPTHLENGECLCDAKTGYKYPWNDWGRPKCDWTHGDDERAAFICDATGGHMTLDDKCACPTTMVLNDKGTYCLCKNGEDYKDPTAKRLGCEKK